MLPCVEITTHKNCDPVAAFFHARFFASALVSAPSMRRGTQRARRWLQQDSTTGIGCSHAPAYGGVVGWPYLGATSRTGVWATGPMAGSTTAMRTRNSYFRDCVLWPILESVIWRHAQGRGVCQPLLRDPSFPRRALLRLRLALPLTSKIRGGPMPGRGAGHRLDMVIYGITLWGGALCCDATLSSRLSREGLPQGRAEGEDGNALAAAERRKQGHGLGTLLVDKGIVRSRPARNGAVSASAGLAGSLSHSSGRSAFGARAGPRKWNTFQASVRGLALAGAWVTRNASAHAARLVRAADWNPKPPGPLGGLRPARPRSRWTPEPLRRRKRMSPTSPRHAAAAYPATSAGGIVRRVHGGPVGGAHNARSSQAHCKCGSSGSSLTRRCSSLNRPLPDEGRMVEGHAEDDEAALVRRLVPSPHVSGEDLGRRRRAGPAKHPCFAFPPA